MSCLRPLHIINPKFRFSQVGGHPMYLDVPCGRCAGCQQKNADGFVFRAYYEALDTFRNGGFVLNDTLTYDNKHLPHLSDFIDNLPDELNFACFSYRDFRLFMVRLRKRLTDMGYSPKANLKYFMSSEYGTSENGTHRPHYHVLFFVRDCSLDPFVFSKVISECWYFGRTDGLPYKTRMYVLNKRLFSQSSNNDLIHLSRVTTYVAKYIAKDSWFDAVVSHRLNSILVERYGLEWRQNEDAKEFHAELSRLCSQFHRNSQHFGECALKYNDISEVKRTGYMRMPDSKNVVRLVPLSVYFSRKLFYDLTKDFRGKYVWQLNKDGVQFRLNKFNESCESLVSRFNDWYASLPTFNPSNYSVIRDRFDSLLAHRPLSDFATYLLAYRGRILPTNYFGSRGGQVTQFSVNVPPLDLMLTLPYEDGLHAYNYTPRCNKVEYKVTFSYKGDFGENITNGTYVDTKEYIMQTCIDENMFVDFRNFDKMFDLYCSSLVQFNMSKNNLFNHKQHLKDVFKCCQNNYKPIKLFNYETCSF